ncbi:UdgX family uracil-DNA binding protein [Thermomonas carbonis]|uniref:Type-4 uracil-DNA glycosylase n=1 Tax=Thermomonas carbonis TaxID=1463158 RepID=A0A7G9SV33_9GAMM|nr:UdgX family uracil-DNA binding protein [Thermomonas carbonis]QNN71708.1 UdgX family uracil-DNA binding protein [Thermomonas carbonis]
MWSAAVEPAWSIDAFREAARAALRAEVAPEYLDWEAGSQQALLALPDVREAPALRASPRVPSGFLGIAETVLCHRDSQRHGLLYRLLWRVAHDEPHVLGTPTDADTRRAMQLAQEVRRDAHKMKAFVRFREVPGEHDNFIAWFEPGHHILQRVAPFFARRFAGMRWAILTPEGSALWDGESLSFGPGGAPDNAPAFDAGDDLWRTYYSNIFNPARLNPRMMRQEMPLRYWKHLPEAHLLPSLINGAGVRVRKMAEREHAAPRRRIPAPVVAEPTDENLRDESLASLRKAAQGCRACPLWEPATQTVFGEGPENARILVLGEQPGDMEDLSGRPFVGPAGKLLDRALADLGIDRSQLYLTNAVKHFRFERRGKQRLHRNPEASHVQACRSWLAGEIERVRPQLIVCLGGTAALAVFGKDFRLMEQRGTWQTLHDGTRAFATVHPAWILRQPENTQQKAYANWLDDLRLLLNSPADPPTPGA